MALSIGTKLTHYEIGEQLGAGGMGAVYRAKDRKLSRDVAIKILPEEFAKDTDRVARFRHEAKVLASLNHPSIAAIYGIEEYDETNFLVLELVEGETLADRIKQGPIPVEEALKLALQIAEALEAAHEKGVIHRDLKPANIKVTPEGKVKVLDFGLAKAYAGEQAELNLSNSPTLSDMATQQGVILGTAAYMSPEQAKGRIAEKRADIWAFGVVLFEILTGRGAFQGEDVSEILASVIKGDVKLDLLPTNIHPRVRETLTRCLQKDLKRRYSGISDARYELEQALADPSGVLVQPLTAVEPRRELRTMVPWIAAAIVLAGIITGVAVWKLKPPEPRQVMRFDYELPEDQQFSNIDVQTSLAVSPDGKQFVYSTTKGLYLRSVDEWNARLIAGTEGPTSQPFFAPDGKWIGYLSNSDRMLKKIAVNGGAAVPLCSVSGMVVGVSWRSDHTIVYGGFRGIMRVSADGGTPESLIKTQGLAILPHILPNGKSILYTEAAGPSHIKVMVKSLESGEPKELFAGAAVAYLRTGHIIFGLPDNDSLFAIPFDPDTLEVKGPPIWMIEGVMGNGAQCAISDSGTLIYMPGRAEGRAAGRASLVWVDRNGNNEPIGAEPNLYFFPRISPDGTKVAVSVFSGSALDIRVWDLDRKTMAQLTFNEASDSMPVWTTDGKRIAYRSIRGGKSAIYWKAADGTGVGELLVSGSRESSISPHSWSKDGKTLLFMEMDGKGTIDVGAVSIEGNRSKKLLLHEKHREVDPKISPDGRWMAYTSNESGNDEIYVRSYPDLNGGKWRISTSGGVWPLWSRDGGELFYRSGDAFMAVPVKTEPTFNRETPKTLFRGDYEAPANPFLCNWDISLDAKRFLMIKRTSSAPSVGESPRKINIVINWLEELKQRVPVK